MMDEEVEQPLHKRQKMQHKQDEANGRDLEELQEAFFEAEEAAAQALEALRETGEPEALEALCGALEDFAFDERPSEVWKKVCKIGNMVSDSKVADADKNTGVRMPQTRIFFGSARGP